MMKVSELGLQLVIDACTSKSKLCMARIQLRFTVNYEKFMEMTQCIAAQYLVGHHAFVEDCMSISCMRMQAGLP
jgi:hypothetical protein